MNESLSNDKIYPVKKKGLSKKMEMVWTFKLFKLKQNKRNNTI